MSRWTVVEANVFRAFLCGLCGAEWNAASAAYHAVQTFNTRLSMTNAVVSITFAGTPQLAKWTRLNDRARKQALSRNKIAHWITVSGPQQPIGSRMWLTQNSDNAAVLERNSGKPRPRLYAANLKAIDEAFMQLSNDLYDWAEQINLQRTPPA